MNARIADNVNNVYKSDYANLSLLIAKSFFVLKTFNGCKDVVRETSFRNLAFKLVTVSSGRDDMVIK